MAISSKMLKNIDRMTTSINGIVFENLTGTTGDFQILNSSNLASIRLTDAGTTGMIIEQTGDGDMLIRHTSSTSGDIIISNTKGSPSSSITVSEVLSIFSDAIRLAGTNDTTAGNIRWDGNYFQGYDGTDWLNFHSKGITTLTDAATVNWDVNNSNHASITLGGNREMANPTNLQEGMKYSLIVRQDATGSRTLDLTTASVIKIPINEYPSLSTAANAVDLIEFFYDGTDLFLTNFKADYS